MRATIRDIDYCLQKLDRDGMVIVGYDIAAELDKVSKSAEHIFFNKLENPRNGIIKSGIADFIAHTFMVDGAINIYTNKNILRIAERYTGSKVHLSNHRIYRNRSSFRGSQEWHKDNKMDFVDESGKHTTVVVKNDRGLIMICYLSDVKEGGTEFILGSHKIENHREVFSDREARELGERFVANGMAAGTVILYDYRMIHRASPVRGLSHSRISLFAQMSPHSMPAGEPILLPTSLIGALSSQQAQFLNFNSPPTAPNWPLRGSSTTSFISNAFKGLLP